jgi:hypothetical protein
MIYELTIAIGTILFLSIIWAIFTHTVDVARTTFKNMTPSSFNISGTNTTVDKTALNKEFDLGFNVIYFSFFFIALILLVWVVKKANEYQARYGGG